MTAYIYHRQNSLKNILKLKKKNIDGVEIDLR